MIYECELCKKKFESDKHKRFCTRSCANTRIHSPETKKKIRDAFKTMSSEKLARVSHIGKGKKRTYYERTCQTCNLVTITTHKNRKFCSLPCSYKNPALGGARAGSGHSKSGWYKGIYCGSSWELAFLLWNELQNITVSRCTESFQYVDGATARRYYPDFIIDGVFFEIKGWADRLVKVKVSQFPTDKKLIIVGIDEMKPILDWVRSTYGKDFISLYEGNPHNEKHNVCIICDNPCKNTFCSRRCTAFGNNPNLKNLYPRRELNPASQN